jgi:peptide/nickel transport system ATP-binding protein
MPDTKLPVGWSEREKMEKLLEVDQLTKVFSLGSIISRIRITATENVSFYIKPAEIFALAGESGCGKTTAARMILGFEEPTSGEIVHKGKRGADTKNEKVWFTEGVQAIFQDPFGTFNPLRTVDRYFFETIQNFGLAGSNEEAIDLIEEKLHAVGLSYDEFSGKYPCEFSGGQLQRVSIARALLTNPTLLIADEPVSMVDASLRMSIVNLFKQLKEESGVSVLYITHDLATAYYVSDRIAIMFRGHIVEMGPVEQVLMHPKHSYTRLLRESIPEADPRRRWSGKITLSDIEYEEYLRQGCRFAGRCPGAMEICKRKVPEDVYVDGVLVKCHKYTGNGDI